MIANSRPSVTPINVEAVLNRQRNKQGRLLTELEEARMFYQQIPAPTKAFDFKLYRDPAICVELDALYHEKCAYCETAYGAASARNVEHFRPKGKIKDAPADHFGYWWLASNWANLIPSCPGCNQYRRVPVYEPGMSLAEFEERRLKLRSLTTTGKGNRFPLNPPSTWAATEAEDCSAEDPLLIHPEHRKPEDHIEWFFDWDQQTPIWLADSLVVSVRPIMRNGVPDPYGKTSIAVYGLNRAGLFRERMARLKIVQTASCIYIDALAATEGIDEAKNDSALKNRREFLNSFCLPTAPFAGMARAYVKVFEEEVLRLAG